MADATNPERASDSLEREKWGAERRFRERELELREREQEHKNAELALAAQAAPVQCAAEPDYTRPPVVLSDAPVRRD
jgi:hypothetical protein